MGLQLIQRVYERCEGSEPIYIWDAGYEFWELRGGIISHYKPIHRAFVNSIATEYLSLLPESPIPLGVVYHCSTGWRYEDRLVEVPAPVPSLTLHQPYYTVLELGLFLQGGKGQAQGKEQQQQQMQMQMQMQEQTLKQKNSQVKEGVAAAAAVEKGAKTPPKKMPAKKRMKSPVSLKTKLVVPELPVEETQQPSYNHAMEPWSPLSQWIPQHALFQPSLHLQASLELSDILSQTYPSQKSPQSNSRPVRGPPQHAGRVQNSKPYRPKNSFQAKEAPSGPLFI